MMLRVFFLILFSKQQYKNSSLFLNSDFILLYFAWKGVMNFYLAFKTVREHDEKECKAHATASNPQLLFFITQFLFSLQNILVLTLDIDNR